MKIRNVHSVELNVGIGGYIQKSHSQYYGLHKGNEETLLFENLMCSFFVI